MLLLILETTFETHAWSLSVEEKIILGFQRSSMVLGPPENRVRNITALDLWLARPYRICNAPHKLQFLSHILIT